MDEKTKAEKIEYIKAKLRDPHWKGDIFSAKWKDQPLEKRITRVEKILGFIGALENWEDYDEVE